MLILVDVTARGDDNILSAEANDLAFRREQLQRLQDEVIDLEDVKTGVSIKPTWSSTIFAWIWSLMSRQRAVLRVPRKGCMPSLALIRKRDFASVLFLCSAIPTMA
jgi:hypothetical protein